MLVKAAEPDDYLQSLSHKTSLSLLPIHKDAQKNADDNQPHVEKTTIVEPLGFLYNFENLPKEVAKNIVSHCEHLYPWLFVGRISNCILSI